jgi:hypothetical protein
LRRRKLNRVEGQKRILVSWNTDPRYIAPFKLSDMQVTVGPRSAPDQALGPFDGFTPSGRFDLSAALKSQALPGQYDAVVVRSDFTGGNQPLNLDVFDCPKILCVADIHQQAAPIRRLIDYAHEADFDFILCSFTRQHAHWFIEAGFEDVAWIPGLVPNLSRPWSADRRREVCFFGGAGNTHPRRTQLLTDLKNSGALPLVVLRGPQEIGADRYAASSVSLNCSLNGDLNLRIFEILAAGGCLLTDRLSPAAGLDLLLQEGRDYVGYDSVEECMEQAGFLIQHNDLALGIARSGYDQFNAQMRPEKRARQLLDWVFHGRLDSLFRVTDFAVQRDGRRPPLETRIHLYEGLQELHRKHLSPSVLFMDDVPDIQVLDALDLRHLQITLAAGKRSGVFESAKIFERCRMMRHEEAARLSWDLVVTADGKMPKAFM